MGFLDYFKTPDINQGVAEFVNTPNSLLLDVRSEDEYAAGHIPGSVNLPMQRLLTSLGFVHCGTIYVNVDGDRHRMAYQYSLK